MKTGRLIAVDEFCNINKIESSFINSLEQTGLIEITTIDEKGFIDSRQLQQLEKLIRFYYEFDINLEGIETITGLLQQITSMQDEIIALRNRLSLYEKED